MTLATAPELDAMLAAYNATPGDYTLVGAMADWCDEHEMPAAADCLRWVAAKHRNPRREYPLTRPPSWSFNWCHMPMDTEDIYLPACVRDVYHKVNPSGWSSIDAVTLLRRLISTWQEMEPDQRAAAWAWEPGSEKHRTPEW